MTSVFQNFKKKRNDGVGVSALGIVCGLSSREVLSLPVGVVLTSYPCTMQASRKGRSKWLSVKSRRDLPSRAKINIKRVC